MAKPDCYKCTHRRDLTGSAHSWCDHPILAGEGDNVFAGVFSLYLGENLTRIAAAYLVLGIDGSEHGTKKGWFSWPFNFDPIWLKSCNGWTDLDTAELVEAE